MALIETLLALLAATNAMETLSSRDDVYDAIDLSRKGKITNRELAQTGEALLGDLDDRSLSDIPAWQPAMDAVHDELYA